MNMRFIFNKKFSIIAVVLLLVSGFLIWNFYFKTVVVSYEFRGRILSVENNSIFSEGIFVVSDKTVVDSTTKKVEIVISEQTKIKQIVKTVPAEFLNKNFRFGDVPSEEKIVDMETLEQDLASNNLDVKALSDKNIYGDDKIYPSEIDYMIIILNK